METTIVQPWSDYELIQTGDRQRLERFGSYFVVRPESNALWSRNNPDQHWQNPDASFLNEPETGWKFANPDCVKGWWINWQQVKFLIKPTPFRHLCLFPEQVHSWEWLSDEIKARSGPVRVLNLFAYTGAASVVAAKLGASVCHVDSSKPALDHASLNAKANQVEIRWIHEDVLKFIQREQRRGSKYDLILADPPVFGRGSKGEVWRLESNIATLTGHIGNLLAPNGKLLLNFYATDLYPESLSRIVSTVLKRPTVLGSLSLWETKSKMALQTGFYLKA